MFVLTLGKNSLRRLGATALAGVALAGAVFAAGSLFNQDTAPAAAAPEEVKTVDPAEMKIANTEGLDQFFKAYGLEADLAGAAVDKVKVPKKWDESFAAFNTVIKESGLSLEKYKGKTVEKWTVLCPTRSTGEEKAYGVVLVYKQQPVGAYLMQKPSGEVTGLARAGETMAPLSPEQAQETAALFGAELPAVETAAQPQQAVETVGQYELDQEAMARAQAAAMEALENELAAAGAEPVD